MLPSIPFLISILFLFPTLTLSISFTSNSVLFCKCICFGSSTIVPLYLPKDPTHPCLTCTQQFCLDQKFPSCIGAKVGKGDLDTGTGKDGDVESRCFRKFSHSFQLILKKENKTDLLFFVCCYFRLFFFQRGIHLNHTS